MPNFGKSAEIPPPQRMAQRGVPLFFKNRRQGGVDFWDLTEKLAKKGVPPFWALFWGFWAFSVKTVQAVQASRENGTPASGGNLRGPPEGRFGP